MKYILGGVSHTDTSTNYMQNLGMSPAQIKSVQNQSTFEVEEIPPARKIISDGIEYMNAARAELDSAIESFVSLANAGGIDKGDYADSLTFDNYYDLVVYERGSEPTMWKAKSTTTLPHVVDATAYPSPYDNPNIQPFVNEVTEIDAIALVNNVPIQDVTYLQLGTINSINYFFHVSLKRTYYSPVALSGEVTTFDVSDPESVTITVSGTQYALIDNVANSLSKIAKSEADITSINNSVAALIEGQVGGIKVYETYAELTSYTPVTAIDRGTSYKVTNNDSDTSKNGYYSWISGTTYRKNANLANGVIEHGNVDPVSGEVVYGSQEVLRQNLGAITSDKALTFYRSIVDSSTVPQFSRGDLSGADGNVSTGISGWRSPFTSDGTAFDALVIKMKDNGRKAEVRVTITDSTFNTLAQGTLTVESGTSYEQQVVVLNNHVRAVNGEVCYIEYLAVDLTHYINQAKGADYSATDPDINAYPEMYTSDGDTWQNAEPVGEYCISFKALDSAVLLSDTNILKTINDLKSAGALVNTEDWKSGIKQFYGGDVLDAGFDSSYSRNGVGIQVAQTPKELEFNKITIWGSVEGSTEVILKAYYADLGTSVSHVPNSFGTPLLEVQVSDWDSVLSKREISLDKVYTVPKDKILYILIVPATGAGKAEVARWTTDDGGGTYPLDRIRFVVSTSANGADNFDGSWGQGSSTYLGVPPLLEVVANSPNAVSHKELAKKVDKFTPRVTIPDTLTAVVGVELNIYYDGITLGIENNIISSPQGLFVQFFGSIGQSLERQYRLNPVTDDIGNHSITIKVFDMFSRMLMEKTVTVNVIPYSGPSAQKTIVQIGDSLFSGGKITTPIYDSFIALGGTTPIFEGSQGTAPKNHEAYGGWTFNRFATAGVLSHRFDVSGVTSISVGAVYSNNGENYTVTEVNITTGSGNINTTSDSNIDPLASGTLTKVSGSGDSSVSYSSFTEEAGNPLWNPATTELDIAYYRGNLSLEGLIDIVTIQLGVNDSFGDTFDSQAQVDLIIIDAKLIIDAFLADNAATKIILTLPTTGGNSRDGWAANYGSDYSKISFENNIYLLRESMLSTFDSGAYSANVITGISGLAIDRKYGYSMTTYPVAARITDVNIDRHTNAVHPRQEGYDQIADAYFGELLNIINV
jgi:hypothetical protein